MLFPVQLNKENGIPLYVQLEEQIRLLIHRGELWAGDLMPTVRELAVQLEINSNTVARVYRDLQQDGILTLRRGVGTFVSMDTQLRAMPRRDWKTLEKQVDALIGTSVRMQLTPVELLQLIETRWKENADVHGKQ
jgi:DNA-binding transcriptional regulator YhcF (GntR family)